MSAGFPQGAPAGGDLTIVNGVTTADRALCMYVANLNGGIAITDGVIYLVGFIPTQLTNASTVTLRCTAGGTSQTGAFVGIYQLDASGNGTRIAQSASTTSIISSSGTKVVPLTTPALLQPGVAYAFALLSVGPGSGNGAVYGAAGGDTTIAKLNVQPYAAGTSGTGQSTLPATLAASTVTAGGNFIYAELTA